MRIEFRHIGDADRERAACQPDTQSRRQQQRIAVGMGREPGGDRREHHDGGERQPPTDAVGPDSEHDPGQRSGQDRRADEQAEFGFGQAEIVLDRQADDREDRPDRETGGEGRRADAQRPCRARVWLVVELLQLSRSLPIIWPLFRSIPSGIESAYVHVALSLT